MFKKSKKNDSIKQPLRLWPGIAIVAVQWFLRFGLPEIMPDALPIAIFGSFLCGLLVVIWWAFFSRAAVFERWSAVALMIFALAIIPYFLHESIASAMMGMMFPVYTVPILSLFFVAWAFFTRDLSDKVRRITMVAAIFTACGALLFVRTGGFTGDLDQDFAWRWSETPEEQLLANEKERLTRPASPVTQITTDAEWPGFRGPNRDGIVSNIKIATDWSAAPPRELWRRAVGPGWSSFAVQGDVFYTQEQRGDNEVVSCYKVTSGEPVWRHQDAARFWEANAGAGPRGTPTLNGGRVYAFGATGILNALDASTGKVIWSRNVSEDTGVKTPGWGFSSSPIVVDSLVIVAAVGKLAAYNIANGESRWVGPAGGGGYSSPHLMTVDSTTHLLLASSTGLISVAPIDGTVLWEHDWPGGSRIVQPALTAGNDILISAGERKGIRRVSLTQNTNGWQAEERWTSIRLKPYFSDFVLHKGHAYGFDGSILTCMNIEDGKRKWKGGRYGHGQLVLLSAQDILLVLSEEGELALVNANTDGFKELARFPAIEGKTWNHPVLIGETLLVRNSEEMAGFRLALASN